MTGVTLDRRGPLENCIKNCNDRFTKLFEDERIRHLAATRACQGLPSGTQKNECLTAEARRHEANMRDLTRAKRECHEGCHQQGGGRIQ